MPLIVFLFALIHAACFGNQTIPLSTGKNFVTCQIWPSGGTQGNINNLTFLQATASLSDPNGVNNARLYRWNCTGYDIFDYFTGADADNYFASSGSQDGWYDAVGNLASGVHWTQGKGMIIEIHSGYGGSLNLIGTSPGPMLPPTNTCPCGFFNLLGRQGTDAGTFDNVTGYSPVEGSQVFRWNGTGYDAYTYSFGAWSPTDPILNSGEAAFFISPCPPASTNCCDNLTPTNMVCITNVVPANTARYFANNLCLGTNNTLSAIYPYAPPGSIFRKYDPTTGGWTTYVFDPDDLVWTPDGNVTLNPGEGYYFESPEAFTKIICGWKPLCPPPCLTNTDRFVLVGRLGVGVSLWTNLSSCPPVCGTVVINLNSNTTNTYGPNGWSPSAPVVPVGEAVFVKIGTGVNCGNCTNTATVICSTNKSVNCGTTWIFDAPVVTEVGGGVNYTVSYTTTTNGTCPKQITRQWQIIDACGNTNTCSQTVTVNYPAPNISCPTNKSVVCNSTWGFNTPSFPNNGCSNTVTVLSTVTNGICPKVITRNWLLSSPCGASNFCSQSVTLIDTVPPVIHCSTNKTVQCGSAWNFDVPTATDNCSGTNITFTVVSTVTNGTCTKTITRTWKATDICGNQSSPCSQVVTVVDTTAPNINLPLIFAQYYTCSTSLVVNFKVTATDACSGSVTPVCTPPSGSYFPIGTTTVTCTATDPCGNTSTKTFKITVVDKTLRASTAALGVDDCFGSPVKAASRSSQLLAAHPLVTKWKNFDEKAQIPFGVSFFGLPKNLTCANLDIKMKPYRKNLLSTASLNDSITVGTPGGITSFIGAGNGNPKLTTSLWLLQNGCGQLFNIDLASQLLNINNNNSSVDVYVQDSTTVDYVRLNYCYCQINPWWGGWDWTTANAQMATGPSFSYVSPLNPLTDYSVTLTPGATHGVKLPVDSINLGSTSNATLSVSAGYNGELNLINDPLIEWGVGLKGDGNGNVGLSLPTLSSNVTQIKVILSLNGAVVRETTLSPNSGLNSIIIMEDGPMLRVLTAQDDRILDAQDDRYTVVLEGPHNIRDCPLCPPTLADQVTVVMVNPARSSADVLTSLTLTANGLPEFGIGQPAVKVGETWAQATGDGTASVGGDQIVVNAHDSSSTNEIGIIIQLPLTNAASFNLATIQDASAMQTNGIVRVEAFGIGSSGQDGVRIAQTEFTQTNDGWDMTTDFSAIGSTQQLYQVYSHGVQVASITFTGSPHVSVLPARINTGNSGAIWTYEWASDGIVSINGSNYIGNELRVSAVAPTLQPIGINAFNIGSSGQDGVMIAGPGSVPTYRQMLPLEVDGDELSVQWTGPAGGAMESAPNVNGPWMIVPNQNSRSAILPSPESPNAPSKQFFRVRSN